MISPGKPTALSIFSGAGGMDIGLEAAGFDHLGVIEIDQSASATLAHNRPEWAHLGEGDVLVAAETLSPESLSLSKGDLDLLAGGPPCQPFSLAAQWAASGRRGMEDPRAQTVHATMKLIRSFLPKAVLMENVLGFVQGRHSAIEYLRGEFDAIAKQTGTSYHLEWRLVNSADYGVPQNRRRVIIVALRDGVGFEWPEPTYAGTPIRAWDAIGDLQGSVSTRSAGKWEGLLESIPAGANYQWLTSRGGGEELFGYRTRYWNFLLKLSPGEPSWTLSASPGPATGPFHWDNRHLTIREQLRLQTFPDDWELIGDERQQVKQVGNATPALLAEVMGSAILQALGQAVTHSPKLALARASCEPPKLAEPKPVRHEYRDLIGAKAAHEGTGRGPSPRPVTVQGLPTTAT
ncbi:MULTISPECIES: DNA cytosine methyltransferase [unclassified Microbacterium]|uniref:DNA cytosine methyltransferase n=1 Tax=unclassified Microbacterium TaxID=2609290 RepID=UPI003441FC47